MTPIAPQPLCRSDEPSPLGRAWPRPQNSDSLHAACDGVEPSGGFANRASQSWVVPAAITLGDEAGLGTELSGAGKTAVVGLLASVIVRATPVAWSSGADLPKDGCAQEANGDSPPKDCAHTTSRRRPCARHRGTRLSVLTSQMHSADEWGQASVVVVPG